MTQRREKCTYEHKQASKWMLMLLCLYWMFAIGDNMSMICLQFEKIDYCRFKEGVWQNGKSTPLTESGENS